MSSLFMQKMIYFNFYFDLIYVYMMAYIYGVKYGLIMQAHHD